MGVLEKKRSHGEFVECSFHFHEMKNKITAPSTHTYLESVPLLNFDLLKHNEKFSLKGEHEYLYT